MLANTLFKSANPITRSCFHSFVRLQTKNTTFSKNIFSPFSTVNASNVVKPFPNPSSKTTNLKKIEPSSILSLKDYEAVRLNVQAMRREIKKNRRMDIGPNATVVFQNYDLIWTQIHEMLLIEKGGPSQVDDEIDAYAPLLPNGTEIVFIIMLGWPNVQIRRKRLAELGHIENKIYLSFDNEKINAVTKDRDTERTTPEGKTSAVHFLAFQFDHQQVSQFKYQLIICSVIKLIPKKKRNKIS